MKRIIIFVLLTALVSSCKTKKASCEAYGENTYPATKKIYKSK